jgi:uncharacterized phiE125 gp8 family phage protein
MKGTTMAAILLVPPSVEPCSVAEAKSFLRVEHDDDAVIASLVAAARGQIEALTRRALLAQSWRIVLDAGPADGRIRLRIGPLRRLIAARVFDHASQAHALDAASLVVDAADTALAAPCWALPVPGRRVAGIELDVELGFGDAALYMQTNFSTKALFGLLGLDEFSLKVTPDASNYFSSLRAWSTLHGRLDSKDARRRHPIAWSPRPGTTTLDSIGLTATITGTATAVSPSSGNLFLSSPRIDFASAGTVGASAGANGSELTLWRGNGSSLGGFYLLIRFGIETFQATSRLFAGLYSSASAIGNVNPSTLFNIIGVGFDSGDTTLSLLSNDGACAVILVPAFQPPVGKIFMN